MAVGADDVELVVALFDLFDLFALFALFDLVVKDVNCQSPLSPAGECDSILSQGRCLGRADQ